MDFEGDVLFVDSPDGGNLVIENGLFACDKSFKTAVLLSLFGGNIDDPAVIESNKEWWGNDIGDKETALRSRFQFIIAGFPLSTKNLKLAIEAIKIDLQWMIDNGVCDDVQVSGMITDFKSADFTVKIFANSEIADNIEFKVNWEAMRNGV